MKISFSVEVTRSPKAAKLEQTEDRTEPSCGDIGCYITPVRDDPSHGTEPQANEFVKRLSDIAAPTVRRIEVTDGTEGKSSNRREAGLRAAATRKARKADMVLAQEKEARRVK